MAPPRRILRQQLEILMDFLEENKDMSKGLPPGAPVTHQATRQKWAVLAKLLNGVQGGEIKTPDGWKRYWFAWRHKCRKKGVDARRFQSNRDGGSTRFIPLNDLEVRVLELSGKGSVKPTPSTSKQLDDFLAEDSDSEPLENVKSRTIFKSSKVKKSLSVSNTATDDETQPMTPPPKWALELEERRIAAEERMAQALESAAATLRAQEQRRSVLDERMADALTALTALAHDLGGGLQDVLHQLRHHAPHDHGPPDKDVFL